MFMKTKVALAAAAVLGFAATASAQSFSFGIGVGPDPYYSDYGYRPYARGPGYGAGVVVDPGYGYAGPGYGYASPGYGYGPARGYGYRDYDRDYMTGSSRGRRGGYADQPGNP